MNKSKYLLALISSALVLPLTGFTVQTKEANQAAPAVNAASVISALRNKVRVQASATVYTDFGVENSQLNSESKSTFDRLYGSIDDNGKETPAVVDMSLANPITYYEGANHNVWTDYLMPDNTVEEQEVFFYGMPQTFARTYTNPWEYINARDLDTENLTLDSAKASLILEDYLGLDFAVESAELTFTDGALSHLEIESFPKAGIKAVGTASYDITENVTASFDFTYPDTVLSHLTARDENNTDLATALAGFGTNYTAYVLSDTLAKAATFYVTEGSVYFHTDAYANHVTDGDYYFLAMGSTYTVYKYSETTKDWANANIDFGAAAAPSFYAFAPRLSEVSADLFNKVNDETYSLDQTAATYTASYLGLQSAYTGLDENSGVSGSVTLKDGKVYSAQSTYELGYTTYVGYSDYGTTELPAWFSVTDAIM